MKKIIFAILALLVSGCAAPIPSKLFPEYKGVDERVEKLTEEYKWLSVQNNITFYNKVTVGFKPINRGNIIGICNSGLAWREIDLDVNYWYNSTNTSHMALIFHELTHCYCGRGHDYDSGKYPESASARLSQALYWKEHGGPRPGYYDDGCPTSLMYPEVLDDDCMMTYYSEYIKEMFNHCNPF